MTGERILIGMNARLFPNNWRPVREEIAFAAAAGFKSIQLPGPETGLDAERLGDNYDVVAHLLKSSGITPVMEMIVRLVANGKTAEGRTPLEVFEANLPAIRALNCTCVHQHLVPIEPIERAELSRIEEMALPQFDQAAARATAEGFRFGIEHNEPSTGLFATPERCRMALDAVPTLGFVWDLNHTIPDHLTAFKALIPRMQMLHVADTPLPAVNHHLPLGLGTVDFVDYCRALLDGGFTGPAILEIGGLPISGGYGRDTDEALISSALCLAKAIAATQD